MVFEKDFRGFCSLLNEKKIDYLIVGGYAVAFHGARAPAILKELVKELAVTPFPISRWRCRR